MKIQILITTPIGTIYGKITEAKEEDFNQTVELVEKWTEHISNGNLENLSIETQKESKTVLPLQLLKNSYIEVIRILNKRETYIDNKV